MSLAKRKGHNMNYRQAVDNATQDLNPNNDYQLQLNTTAGIILLDLWYHLAPEHCKSIIGLTRIGYHNNTIIHRIIPNFIIQMGSPNPDGTGHTDYTIHQELHHKLHQPGVLAMARADGKPHSASSQFYICLNDAPHLDHHYTTFGKTANTESLELAKQIATAPTDKNNRPRSPVTITTAIIIVHEIPT